MSTENKTFAFKLAADRSKESAPKKARWSARDDVSIAGCSQVPEGPHNILMDRYGQIVLHVSSDSGPYC